MHSFKTLLLLFLFCLLPQAELRADSKSSTIAITSNDELLLVVNTDSNSVTVVDVSGDPDVLGEIEVGRFPQTIALDAQDALAFVTSRADDTLSVLDLNSLEAIGCIAVKDEPFGVVADDNYLYVANQSSDSISVIHRVTYLPLLEIETEAAPKGLALSEDGSRLFVTHFFSGHLSVIDTNLMSVTHVIDAGSNANVSQSIEMDPENNLAYLPQTFSNSTNEALLFDTTVSPVVSIMDLDSLTNLRSQRIAVDIVDTPVGIPIDSIRSLANNLYVVNAASNDVSVINLDTSSGIAHIEVGDNPRGIVLSEAKQLAYVSNSLSGTVSIIDINTHEVTDELHVTEIPLSSALLNGKRLFNSSNTTELARDQWIACSSCHFEGEHDGRTWFFDDGPRNTPSLIGIADTLPMHWSGDLDELHDVESTIRNIQDGSGLTEGDGNCTPACDQAPSNEGRSTNLDDLALYMESLVFIANQELDISGEAAQLAGAALFNSSATGCANCHVPPLYTDKQTHDVGTGNSALEAKGFFFDTPSLLGIFKTAPYLHDGSADSLRDVLTVENVLDSHGTTSHLTETEVAELESFLKGLSGSSATPVNSQFCNAPAISLVENEHAVALKLSLNQRSFSSQNTLRLSLHVAGEGSVDLYGAVRLPDNSFVTIGPGKTISDTNTVIPLRSSLSLHAGQELEMADIVLPDNLPVGEYSAFGIAVAEGDDVLNPDAWIILDEIAFQLK